MSIASLEIRADRAARARSREWLIRAQLAAVVALSSGIVLHGLITTIRLHDVFPFGDMIDVLWRYFVGPARAFWIYQDNEHLPLVVMPLFWLDFVAFKAQAWPLIACNLMLAVGIAVRPLPALRRAGLAPAMTTALVAFSAAAEFWLGNYVNLTWPKQVHMYVSMFAATCALASAARDGARLWPALAWAAVSTFGFGYGICTFPALLAMGFLRRWDWQRTVVTASVMALCLALYVGLSNDVLGRNTGAAYHYLLVRNLLACGFAFLGSPWFSIVRPWLPQGWSLLVAWSTAGLGLGVLGWFGWSAWRRRPTELVALGLGLAGFSVVAAIQTAFARSYFGALQMMDSRYIIGELPFWTGLLLCAAGRVRREAGQLWLGTGLALTCIGFAVSQAAILPVLRNRSFNRWQSAMAAINDVQDPDVAQHDELWHMEREPILFQGLRREGWSVYAWPERTWLGSALDRFAERQGGCSGAIANTASIDGLGRRFTGWAADRGTGVAPWILLTDHAGTILGLGHTGGNAATPGAPAGSAWTGYVHGVSAGSVEAWLLVKNKHPCRFATG